MADDREIAKKIWDGKVPIMFHLAQSNLATEQEPVPYCLLAPRCSYFPLVTAKVRKHFQSSAIGDTDDEMWFEYKGQPLKWHYPIGVLFDFYGSPSQLPFEVTVHFQAFPEDEILRCPDPTTVEQHYMNMLKESDYLKRGNTQTIMGLQKRDQKQLWTSIRTMKFESFWEINRRLMKREETDSFRNIPFRIYAPDSPVLSEPFAPIDDNGEERTLGHLLSFMLPQLFPPGLDAAQSVQPPSKDSPSPQIVIHGITPAMETPLVWLLDNASHPDGFLHICVNSAESPM